MTEYSSNPSMQAFSLAEPARALIAPVLFNRTEAALREIGHTDQVINDDPLLRYQIMQDYQGGQVVADTFAFDESHTTKVAIVFNRGEDGRLHDIWATRRRFHFDGQGGCDAQSPEERLVAQDRRIQVLELSPLVVVRNLRRAAQLIQQQQASYRR